MDWRTAVSRAYYAVFHVAAELMTSFRFTVPNADRAHGYLWLRLQNCGDPVVEHAGAITSDLRRARNKADYVLNRPIRQAQAQIHVQNAEAVIKVLDAIVEPTRTQTINTIRAYEQNVLKDVTWHP